MRTLCSYTCIAGVSLSWGDQENGVLILQILLLIFVVNFHNYFSSQVYKLSPTWGLLSLYSLLVKVVDPHPLRCPGKEEKFKYLFTSVKFMSPLFGAINILCLHIVCWVGNCQFLELIYYCWEQISKCTRQPLVSNIHDHQIRISLFNKMLVMCFLLTTEMKTSLSHYHLHPVLDVVLCIAPWQLEIIMV